MAARKRKVTKQEGSTRGTEFRVLSPDGTVLETRESHTFALVRAQRRAEQAEKETSLEIERRTLFGPPVRLTRVVRDEDGVVHTLTLSHED